MKFFVYLISIVLIIALAGLFVFKKPDGQAWIKLDDVFTNTLISENEIKFITDKALKTYQNLTTDNSSQSEQSSEVKIYRFKDSKGNWSYSDNPKASDDSEEVILNPNDIIVLPAFKEAENDSPRLNSSTKAASIAPEPLPHSPDNVLELYKNANNVQKLMDGRQEKISKAIKDNTN